MEVLARLLPAPSNICLWAHVFYNPEFSCFSPYQQKPLRDEEIFTKDLDSHLQRESCSCSNGNGRLQVDYLEKSGFNNHKCQSSSSHFIRDRTHDFLTKEADLGMHNKD